MTRVRARPIAQTSGALALLKNISPAACFNTPQGESQGLSGDSHQDGRWERKAKLMKALRQAQREMHASNGQGKRKDRLTNYFLIYDSQGVWSGPGCWEEHRIAQSWIRLSFVIETLKDFTLLPHIKPISDTISRQSGIFKLTAEGAICRRILPNGRGREFSQILYVTDDPQSPDIVAGDDFMRAMMGVDEDDGDETDSEGQFIPVSLFLHSLTKNVSSSSRSGSSNSPRSVRQANALLSSASSSPAHWSCGPSQRSHRPLRFQF